VTGTDFAVAVLRELDVIGGVDTPDASDVNFVLSKANRILDNWNAEWGPAYAETLNTYTLTPNLQPHTIGPSGATWTATQRPESIESINLIIGSGIRLPIHLRDDTWRMSLGYPVLAIAYPSDVTYRRDLWPLAEFYFFPIPTAAYQVEVLSRIVFSALTLSGTFSMPPGYQDAMILSTAEECADNFHAPITPRLQRSASKARARIAATNAAGVRLDTRGDGLPRGGPGWFDYQSGFSR
jgi:hypothetical protein